MSTMAVWYAHVSEDDLRRTVTDAIATYKGADKKRLQKTGERTLDKTTGKAHAHDSLDALAKLGEFVDGRYRIVSQPPIVVPARELGPSLGMSPDDIQHTIEAQFHAYRVTLRDDQRQLLERFEIVDVARKVVGVGSVGTRAYIALLQGRDEHDPLFLQVKEATASVLEDHLPKSRYDQPGERVVQGQRLIQASSDIFLGWTKVAETGRFLYWRQLRDMKGSAVVESYRPPGLGLYGQLCGRTLARAHARSGDPVAISAYLGKKGRFDDAIVEFSARYADQNEKDFQALRAAVDSGRIEAMSGV